MRFMKELRHANMVEGRVDVLALEHRVESQYLACGRSDFKKKIIKAIKAYAGPASQEKALLMEDYTVLGTCKEGFVLTDKTLYWSFGFYHGKGQCPVEDITAVSIHTSADGKLYTVKLTLGQPSSGDKTVDISHTLDKKEAIRMESFWKELLLLR